MKKISNKLRSIILIFTIALITLVCGYYQRNLKFDYDFEAFFPNEDSERSVYEKFRTTFEYDNEFVLLGLENRKGIFQKKFLEKVKRLTDDLKGIENIKNIVSPTNLKNLTLGGIGPVETPLLHYNNPDLYKEDSVNIYSSE
ncbi:MAG TPA: hypothetical protein VNX68_17190, partial [Nitrosopumilaceae archaeon]|nr:hypothetical protein [Nitrosopumilaceae archaeon]